MKHLVKSFMGLASLHQRKYLINHFESYECKVLESGDYLPQLQIPPLKKFCLLVQLVQYYNLAMIPLPALT
jgi:hypothetical protein